jgi:hypothetical protein
MSATHLRLDVAFSTVVFALTGSRHTVIAPAPGEFEITKTYCRERGIPTESNRIHCGAVAEGATRARITSVGSCSD